MARDRQPQCGLGSDGLVVTDSAPEGSRLCGTCVKRRSLEPASSAVSCEELLQLADDVTENEVPDVPWSFAADL